MKRCNWKILLACAVLVTASCTKNKKQEKEIGNNFREGEIVVRTEKMDAILKENPGLKVTELYPEINLYKVSGKSLAGKEAEIAEKWEKDSLAKSANPNFI